MGNIEQHQGFNSTGWLKQYEIIEQNLHDHIMLIQSIKSKEEYYGKVLTCRSKSQIEKIDRLIQLKSTFHNKFVSQIIDYKKQNTDNFCNTNVQYSFAFEKGEFSLKDETYNRKFKYQQFHEAEIMLILESAMKGLLFLQQIGQKHQRISSQNIFIRDDRSIFLSDPWLYSSKETSIFKMNETGYNYPSPQKILFQSDLIDSYDEQLSDYYSLGIVMLQLINMQPMDFIYEKGFRRILDKKIASEIEKIKRNDLRERVQILVNHYPKKRKQIQKLYQRTTYVEEFVQNQVNQFKEKIQAKSKQKIAMKQNQDQMKCRPTGLRPNNIDLHHIRTQSNLTVSNNYNSKQVSNNYLPLRPKIMFTHNSGQIIHQQHSKLNIKQQPKNIKNEQKELYNDKLNVSAHKQQETKSNNFKSKSSKQQIHSQSADVFLSNSNQLNNYRVNSSLDDDHNNSNALKEISYKKLNQLNNIIKEAQSINVSIDQKSEIASEVIGHGFSAKNSMSIGINSKRQSLQQEVRSSIPQRSFEDAITSQPKITYTVSMPAKKTAKESLVKKQVTQVQQDTLTPDRRPLKKRNHSTIKQVSEQSPSIQSHSFQFEQRTIQYDVGTKYIGQLKSGKRNGQGIFYFQDGSYYQGSWKDNKMHGKGCLYYLNGQLAYDGGWYMDSFHGKGRIYNDAPQQLQKEFNYNNMNFIDNYWQVYDGDFFNERKNGNGKLKLSNGEVFVGQFMDDKVNGQGKYYQLNGNVLHGKWVEGILVKEYS